MDDSPSRPCKQFEARISDESPTLLLNVCTRHIVVNLDVLLLIGVRFEQLNLRWFA